MVVRKRGSPLFQGVHEPPVVLAYLFGLNKSPRALIIESTEIILLVGDIGLEIPPDQIRVGAHVFA